MIVDPTDASILKMMLERSMVGANRTRRYFSIVRTMDMFVETIPVKRTEL